jgi:hypothetical protein
MKFLKEIKPKIKEILAQGIYSGMENGTLEVETDKTYTVGIGIDVQQRVINAKVQYALNNAILAANEKTLSVTTDTHSTGHLLRINYGRFVIYPKRVDYFNPECDYEANYHKKLMVNNPTEGELFDISDPDYPIFVQLLFGQKKTGFFAILRIPDSYGDIYEEEELILPSVDTLAPEEKAPAEKKLVIRSEKVAGQ